MYQMCAQVAPSGECMQGSIGPTDWMLANFGAVCYWQPLIIPSGLNLVVAAGLCDSL